MFIKNNSETQTWEGYKIDGFVLDIKPGDIFEVPQAVGFKLLKLLGAPGWLEECEEPKKKSSKKEEPKVVEEKPKKRK